MHKNHITQPQSTPQRRYEVCRAYFLERQTDRQLAQRFGLAVTTVRAMVRDFAAHQHKRVFFVETPRGRKPRPTYATANLPRQEADTMAVRFADHWKQRHGRYPARIILDYRATVYAGLSERCG